MTPTQAHRLQARLDAQSTALGHLYDQVARMDDLLRFIATHVRTVAPPSLLDPSPTPKAERLLEAYARFCRDRDATRRHASENGHEGPDPGGPQTH